MSMDLSFLYISLKIRYFRLKSENFWQQGALEMLTVWCLKRWYCSVIAFDHFGSEVPKRKKVWNCFDLYLSKIFMDTSFLYIILKCMLKWGIARPHTSRFGREIKQKLTKNWCSAFFILSWNKAISKRLSEIGPAGRRTLRHEIRLPILYLFTPFSTCLN